MCQEQENCSVDLVQFARMNLSGSRRDEWLIC